MYVARACYMEWKKSYSFFTACSQGFANKVFGNWLQKSKLRVCFFHNHFFFQNFIRKVFGACSFACVSVLCFYLSCFACTYMVRETETNCLCLFVVSSMVKKIKTKIRQCFHFSVFSSHTFTEYFSTQFCFSVK